jgi:DNA-binding MarR family transcriptional regulator
MNVHRLKKREQSVDPVKSLSMNNATDGESRSDPEPAVTITLSERDRRAAARVLNALVGEADDRGQELTNLAGANVRAFGDQDREALVERARKAFVNRARRSRHFNGVMFGEAAWDMLLALYVTEKSKARHTVTGLCDLSGLPTTTALRWLDFLENKEALVTRSPNPTDKRVYRLALTDKARDALDAYFSGTDLEGM